MFIGDIYKERGHSRGLVRQMQRVSTKYLEMNLHHLSIDVDKAAYDYCLLPLVFEIVDRSTLKKISKGKT